MLEQQQRAHEALLAARRQAAVQEKLREMRRRKAGQITPEEEERQRLEAIARERAAERGFMLEQGVPEELPPRRIRRPEQAKPARLPREYRLYVKSNSGIVVYDTRGDCKRPFAALIEIKGEPKIKSKSK